MYAIKYTRTAAKDIEKLKSANLTETTLALIELIKTNPYQTPPSYEKLMGNLKGAYSRRINGKHRLVYKVFEKERVVLILSLWSHYER